MRFGRILYLVDDRELLLRQLAGIQLSFAEGVGHLRDDVSTDEIIPARHCLELGGALAAHCYRGFRCGGTTPIGEGAIAEAGITVSVSGLRRGKGSSREQAPYAERGAGIKLVMARSFESIYLKNCHNLGLWTSTRIDLLPRIANGEDFELDELCGEVDPVARQLLSVGGLLRYPKPSRARPLPAPAGVPHSTVAERILARHAEGGRLLPAGSVQQFWCDLRYSHEYVTPMAAALLEEMAPDATIHDPESVLLFEDHLSALARAPKVDPTALGKAERLAVLQRRFADSAGTRLHGRVGEWSEGICHQIVLERYARPGQLIVGSDSHTCHSGAVGCLALGVGASDLARAWLTGDVFIRVPSQIRVEIAGEFGEGVTEKDLLLQVLRLEAVRSGLAIGTIVEFAGSGVGAMDIDARATLTNMAVEMGALTGIVAPDGRTVDHLVAHRGMERAAAEAACAGLEPDPLGRYDHVFEISASEIEPMVALPGDPSNGIPVSTLGEAPRITRAYGGSCTGAKQADMDAYATVLRAALASGRRVHHGVEFYIQTGSQAVFRYCEQRGYIELFSSVGATVLGPSCGACINAGPGASIDATDVTISAQNRNFPGRSGPGAVYLASPLTVAASAIEGRISAFSSRR